jgi:transposase
MPAYSPELQPAERLWPIVDEPLANRSFAALEELEKVLYERCQVILSQPELVKGITNFSWWPQSG